MRKYRADLTKALDGPVNEADDGPALVNAGWGWTVSAASTNA